jgi:hypothetical protein
VLCRLAMALDLTNFKNLSNLDVVAQASVLYRPAVCEKRTFAEGERST